MPKATSPQTCTPTHEIDFITTATLLSGQLQG